MNRLANLSVLSIGLTLGVVQAAPQFSNVAWTQDADTRQVTCTYTLTGDAALVTAEVLVAGEPIADLVPPCVAARLEKRKGRP